MYLDSTLQRIREGTRRARAGKSHGKRQAQAVLAAVSSNSWYSSAASVLSEVSYTVNDGLWTPSTSATWTASTQSIWQAKAILQSSITTVWPSSSTSSSIDDVVISTSSSTSEASDGQIKATMASAAPTFSSDDAIQTTILTTLPSSSSADTVLESISSSETQLASSSLTAPSFASEDGTWITSTTAIPLASGVTIIPFITFGKEGSSTAGLPSSVTSNAIATGTSASAFAGPTTVRSSQSLHTSGKNAAGIVAGSIAGVFILVLAVFVYLRGGSIRGFGFRPKDPEKDLLCTRKASQEGPTWVSSRHQLERPAKPSPDLEKSGEIQRESAELRHNDDDEWDEIEVAESRHGYTSPDGGEWLEDWRRRKELLMSRQGPPELKFDPGLPLPPISTRTLENWDSHR